jgi:hypothetical protein
MTKRKPSRTCIFCGGGSLSAEHVFPEWTHPLLPIEEQTGVHWGRYRQTIPQSPTRLTAKAVCEPCNTGWMSDLEVAAGPLLTPLIMGEKLVRFLSPDDQATIAFWAAKTTLLLQYVRPADWRFASPRVCREMYETKSTPQGVCVFMGKQRAEDWGVGFALRPIVMKEADGTLVGGEHGADGANVYVATLGLRHLFFQVGYLAGQEPPVIKNEVAQRDRRLPQIWPDPIHLAGHRRSRCRTSSALA